MKAAVYFSPDNIRYMDIDKPCINQDEILINVKAVGVCGSDLMKIEKKLVPNRTVLGHEVSGDIVQIGENIKDFKVGERVVVAHHAPCFNCHYCLHKSYSMCKTFKQTNIYPGGFAEYVRIPAYLVKNTLFTIPDNLSYESAIFMEPLACCIRAINRTGGLTKDDTVVVIGLGLVGLLFVKLCNFFKAKAIGFDIIQSRVNMATKMGAEFSIKENQEDLKNSVQKLSDNRGADLIILAAGNALLFPMAISLVRDGGIILIFSSTKEQEINMDFNALYFREISLIPSYSPSPYDLQESLELLKSNKIIVTDLISDIIPLSEARNGIRKALNKEVLKVVFNANL